MGKRGAFSFKVTVDLRAKLEAEAKASQRSVAQVIEYRLERSFRDDDVRELLKEALGQYGDLGDVDITFTASN